MKNKISDIQIDLFGKKIKKIENSTQTVEDLRLSPFMPIQKVSSRSVTYKNFIANGSKLRRKTSYGEVEIRNRLLTQHHSDVFHYILANNLKIKLLNNGGVGIYFSLYQLCKKFGLGWGKNSKIEMIEIIMQIKDCSIARYDKKGILIDSDYNLITQCAYSKNEEMFGIALSPAYTNKFYKSLTINHSKRIEEIISIEGEGNGLIKAIINHFITHQADINNIQRVALIKLLEVINYPIDTESQITSAKRYINKFKKTLADFSIKYYKKEKYFEYCGTDNICFLPPLKGIIS